MAGLAWVRCWISSSSATGMHKPPRNGVYSDLNRDPRGHIVSIAYTTRLPSDVLPRAGSDATSAEWVDTNQVTLGLDHAQILADAEAKIFSHIRLEGHDAQADH